MFRARFYLSAFALFLLLGCSSNSSKSDASPSDVSGDAPANDSQPDVRDAAPQDTGSRDARVYPTDDAGCSSVTAKGCCLGQVVMWCDKGETKTRDCAKNATSSPPKPWLIRCGWHPDYKNYDCGNEEEDPSGVYPLWCQGYSPPDAGLPDAAEPPPSLCGDIPFQGCCDGTVAKWCSNGKIESVDCAEVNDACGWRPEDNYYACTEQPDEEPGGSYPRACP